MHKIVFNKPFISHEQEKDLLSSLHHQKFEDGIYSSKVTENLKKVTGAKDVLLTSSCTAALEICCMLIDLGPSDEVILPSYTFVSTANAIVLRGAKPVFVDISSSDLNINCSKIESKITKKTKAIVVVHYAGRSCNMVNVQQIAKKHNLFLIEDAAQCIDAFYDSQHLGTFGDFGCLSFHYTKNITAGFGGALLINNSSFLEKAKVILQRGTNRNAFLDGKVDRYTWLSIGSSYVMTEQQAAILNSQLISLKQITEKRLAIWDYYKKSFTALKEEGLISLPCSNAKIQHNAHIFYILLLIKNSQEKVLQELTKLGVQCTSHYQPLHLSPFYLKNFGRVNLPITEAIAQQIVRLPLYPTLTREEQDYIIEMTYKVTKSVGLVCR